MFRLRVSIPSGLKLLELNNSMMMYDRSLPHPLRLSQKSIHKNPLYMQMFLLSAEDSGFGSVAALGVPCKLISDASDCTSTSPGASALTHMVSTTQA